MASWYPLILLLHLSCAIVFVGAVCFEVLVLESFHRSFDHALMERIEAAVMARVRRFMPVVVALKVAAQYQTSWRTVSDFLAPNGHWHPRSLKRVRVPKEAGSAPPPEPEKSVATRGR